MGNGTSTPKKVLMELGGVVGGVAGDIAVDMLITSAVQAAAVQAAALGGQVIAGTIFGQIVAAQAVLGCSTAAQSVFLGMTTATSGAAALIVISIAAGITLGAGIYWVYTKLKGNSNEGAQPIIVQAISESQLDTNAILENHQSPGLPEFRRIQMTRDQFNNILSLSQGDFKQCVSKVTCQHTMQVMRQPHQMNCCKHLNKVGEKVYIQAELSRNKRCLLCQSPADRSFMKFDNRIYNEILGLRSRLVKVYKQANAVQKRKWKGLIDHQFGPGYTQKHLQKFEFSE